MMKTKYGLFFLLVVIVNLGLYQSYLLTAQEQTFIFLPVLHQSLPSQATPTPTATATFTPLPTGTGTATPTFTPSPTSLATGTPTFTPTALPTATNTPTPTAVGSCPYDQNSFPGRVELEDFTCGGEGVAYHDNDYANQGGAYRPSEGVDIASADDVGGGYYVGWVRSGEWIRYKFFSEQSNMVTLALRYASYTNNTRIQIFIDGVDVAGGVIQLANTGGSWQTYQIHNAVIVSGIRTIELRIIEGWASYNYLEATVGSSTPTQTPTPGPSPTPTATPIPAVCPVQFEEVLTAGDTFLAVTSDLGNQVTITDLTTNQVIGSDVLPSSPVPGHLCPSFALVPVTALVFQHMIMVESSNGAFDIETVQPTPTPTPTPTPAACQVQFEEVLTAGETFVAITGELGNQVTITDLTTNQVIGSGTLPGSPVPGHLCPSFALVPINALVAQHIILVESSNGTFDVETVNP